MTVNNQRVVAYVLIALGVLAIMQRFSGSAGWLIVGLIAVAFLVAYVSRRLYGLLVVGSILAGVAVGILLEGNWGWVGSFLISLGAGFFAIDQVERRENRWPIYVAGILAGLGLIVGLLSSGLLTSVWFALLLIAGGLVLIFRGNKPLGEGNWVQVNPVTAKPSNTQAKQTDTEVTSKVTLPEVEKETELDEKDAPQFEQQKTVDIEKPKVVATTQLQEADEPVTESSSLDEALVKKLETWRRETARAEDKAAYLVLTNESLQLIAQQKPQTLADLNKIKGIGKVKLERYGEALLALIQGA